MSFNLPRQLCWSSLHTLLVVVGFPLFINNLSIIRGHLLEPSHTIRNLKEFIISYTAHPFYKFSSLFGSVFAVLAGIFNPLAFGSLSFIFFTAPAVWFYSQNHPFGIRCNYIAVGQDKGNECRPRDGAYTVQLEMSPGADIDEYRLDIHTPSGAELDRIDGNTSHFDEQRQILYGVIQEADRGEPYTEALYIEKTGSIAPDGELILIKSQGDGYTMEWIKLLPE